METTKDNEILIAFAEAIKKKDIETIKALIIYAGEYEIINEKDEAVEVSKEAYLSWISQMMDSAGTIEYYFDSCTTCIVGGPVVLFNEGLFPYRATIPVMKRKTGVMVKIINENIVGLKFCQELKTTSNKYIATLDMERTNEYARQNHIPEAQAYRILKMLGEIHE